MSAEKYALLRTFRGLFDGKPYRHRIANLGDLVASYLYEDLAVLGKSAKLLEHVERHERVVNLKNVMIGKPSRRGDGTFDEFQILRFRASNARPFPFEWVDLGKTEMEYSAILTRVSREYDRRFP
jgi:hypothetical protein